MLFRQLIIRALLVGLLAGAVLSLLQLLGVSPLILAAEQFEPAAVETQVHDHQHGGDDHGHHHDAEAWAPADGGERMAYTLFSNILLAIGYSALILAFMQLHSLAAQPRFSVKQGLVWGAVGFGVFFVVPSLGLPPEIPGAQAADLAGRQAWWWLAVICSLGGIGLLVWVPNGFRFLGLLVLAIPHLWGAPTHSGSIFEHSDPQVVVALEQLHQQFILASGATNLGFWLVLGMACGWCMKESNATT